MLFGRDPRQKAMLEIAMKQVEKALKEMLDAGKNLENLKIKKFQKTHYTNCVCTKCLTAKRNKDPHKRGLLEDGYKVYVEVADEEEAV